VEDFGAVAAAGVLRHLRARRGYNIHTDAGRREKRERERERVELPAARELFRYDADSGGISRARYRHRGAYNLFS